MRGGKKRNDGRMNVILVAFFCVLMMGLYFTMWGLRPMTRRGKKKRKMYNTIYTTYIFFLNTNSGN